jgi:hypothetical protein
MMRDLMRDFAPLSATQAAGIVGNGGGESGGFTIAQEGGIKPPKGGWGGFQWTGPRRRAYEAYIKAHGGDPTSPRDALNYDFMYGMLKTELKGPEKATIPAMRTCKTVADATKMFMVKFERPGIPHYEGRVSWSQMALDAYNAEEAAIAKDPVIKANAPQPTDSDPAPEPIMRDGITPVPDGIPKPVNNNKSFWGTILGGAGIGAAGAVKFAGQALPWVVLAIGLVLLFIYVLRPAYTRWRDYLQHAPEFADADIKTRFLVFVQGLRTKMLARLVEGLGALTFAFSYADTAIGGTGIDLNSFLPAIHIPFTEMEVQASQYALLLSVGVSRAFDYFRSIATGEQGKIDPTLAVTVAADSSHVAGATPTPALAAVTDPGTLPVDVLAPAVEAANAPEHVVVAKVARKITKKRPAKKPAKKKAKAKRKPAKRKPAKKSKIRKRK